MAGYVITGKRQSVYFLLMGLCIIAAGIVLFLLLPSPWGQSIGLLGGDLVVGILFAGAGIYFYARERNMPVVDERSNRATWIAGHITFLITWFLLGALAALADGGILRVSFQVIVWSIFIAMPWMFLVLRFVVGRRGEMV